ncbi:PepSY domain-containing protein [Georgenia satyanarayanai]|uniref:PepSY domain-containing protein n=1 Tax=Georgenia satyanarayanai TaxID=860221 RepID=UPI00203BD429|nr:PepSY domain-containing protein [Georgenia satyanarayanai]MCM3660357.1 PepSY domain-containing protein [Georgenia satyanarayanai]
MTSPAPEATSTAPATGAADVGDAVAALEQAAGALPDGQPFDVEREDEGGQEIWEIKVASAGQQHTVHVSLDGSQVLQQRQAETPDDDVAKIAAAEVDAITALRTAADEHGGSLDEMEIDTRRDGTLVWEIELVQPDGTVIEVDVDAMTGELIE